MKCYYFIYTTFIVLFNVFVCSLSENLKLGLITPPAGALGFPRVAAASTMALERAKLDGYLTGVDVR